MELSLHGTGYFVRNKTKKKILNKGTNHILVLGESTSYGLMLPNRLTMSYPNLIQKNLNKIHQDKKFEVINLSYPGQTSFSILDNLELNLLKYKPRFAILHFGVNDINPALNPISHLSFFTKIKLLKLIYFSYLYFNFQEKIHEGDHGEFIFYDPDAKDSFTNQEYLQNTMPNYLEVIRLLKKYSVPAVMINYYKSPKVVNELLFKVSQEQNLHLIDLQKNKNADQLMSKDNWHPNKEGHKEIADHVMEYLIQNKLFLN